MIKICYMLAIFCEMGLGIVLLSKMYPEFRFENTIMKVLAILVLGMAGCLYIWNSWTFYVSTTFVIIMSVILATIYWMFWFSNFSSVLLVQLFYCINISILKIPVLTIRGIKYSETVRLVNQGPRTLGEISYILVVLSLFYFWLKKYKNAKDILCKLLLKNKNLCVLTIILEWLMLCYCMKLGRMGFETTDFILNLVIILCIFMTMFAIARSIVYQQMKSDKVLQQETYTQLKRQYYSLKELYETNRRWVHDVKHELIYIGSCLEEENISGAYESLLDYLQIIRQTEKKVWSNFLFLDFMLNYKKAEMEQKEIEFMLDVELQHITIPEEDLVIILGNLLDNAVEAAEKCEKSERYVKVRIHNLNNMLLLSVENSSGEIPQLKNGTFISNKQDKRMHGLGIESVRRIVETYDGEIHFQYTENFFQVQILI